MYSEYAAIVCLLNKTQFMLFFAIHAKQSYETYEPEMSFSLWFFHYENIKYGFIVHWKPYRSYKLWSVTNLN